MDFTWTDPHTHAFNVLKDAPNAQGPQWSNALFAKKAMLKETHQNQAAMHATHHAGLALEQETINAILAMMATTFTTIGTIMTSTAKDAQKDARPAQAFTNALSALTASTRIHQEADA